MGSTERASRTFSGDVVSQAENGHTSISVTIEYPSVGDEVRTSVRTGVRKRHPSAAGPQSSKRPRSTDRGWSDSKAKRAFDILAAAVALLPCAPVMLLTALAVKLSSKGPVLFRQIRVGKGGRNFLIWKFRTMRTDSTRGPSVTKAGDDRLTPIGGLLRRFKLDELPQLLNVLRGDMSLVGARPKVPHHQTHFLKYRPGITGAASLAFRREEELLHTLDENSLDEYQVQVLMPLKRELDDNYMRSATLFSDVTLLFRTVLRKGALIEESELRRFERSLLCLDAALNGKLAEDRPPVSVEHVEPVPVSNRARPLFGRPLVRYASDLLILAFTLLVLPNVVTVLLFGPSTQYFRGWLNLELGLLIAAYAVVRRWPLLILLGLEIVVDLVEPVAHTFYFNPTDGVEALRYLSVLPPERLLIYLLGFLGYLAILLGAFHFGSKALHYRRLSAFVILAVCCLAAGRDLLSGRYAFAGEDRHSSRIILVRAPAASLARRAVWIAHIQGIYKAQDIDSSVGQLFASYGNVIRQQKPNVVVVLVESWGLLKDESARDRLAAPLTTSQTQARYVIQTGVVPFVGPTIFGESREFCDKIFGAGIENASPEQLQQCHPAEFARMGYDTLGIHGFYPRMYGRMRWYPKLGFKRMLFAPQMKQMGLHTCPGGLVGTCDDEVAEVIHRELLAHSAGHPLFLHWTSLNSHLPVQGGDGEAADAECGAFQGTSDVAVCTWYSLVKKVLIAVDKVAVDPALSSTVFVVVGDHAPPFMGEKRRSEFSQSHVPYMILTPRDLHPNAQPERAPS